MSLQPGVLCARTEKANRQQTIALFTYQIRMKFRKSQLSKEPHLKIDDKNKDNEEKMSPINN